MLHNALFRISFGVCLIGLCVSQTPAGNTTGDVTLTASHATIHAPFTKDLDLNCSFVKLPGSEFNNLISLIISKTATPKNNSFVEIAIVTIATPDHVVVKDSLSATVEGKITTGGSFISYKWTYPDTTAEGRYKCIATGMNTLGHIVTDITETIVEEQHVDMQMILDRIQTMEKTQDNLLKQLSATEAELTQTKSELGDAQVQLKDVEREIHNATVDAIGNAKELNKTRGDLEQFIDDVQIIQHEMDQAKSEINHVGVKIDQTNDNISSTESDIRSTKSNITQFITAVNDTNVDIDSSQTDIASFKVELDAVRSMLYNVTSEVNKTNVEVLNAKGSATQYIQSVRSFILNQNQVEANVLALRTAHGDLVTSLHNANLDLSQTNTALDTFKQRLNSSWSKMFLASAVYKGHTYYLSHPFLNMVPLFDGICGGNSADGGYVVEINDSLEWNFVFDFWKRETALIPIYLMIGVTDRASEGTWRFLHSGGTMTYTKWATSNPTSHRTENCVDINGNDGYMYDFPCASTRAARFMCEMPK